MKKILVSLLVLISSLAFAQVVVIKNEVLGSGQPGLTSAESATAVDIREGIFHAPQYMPSYPTAAVIWARVIEVPCVKATVGIKCDGYTWRPEYGRAEYLFIKPVMVTIAPPTVITNTVIKEVPVVVLKEVPAKKKNE